MRRTLKVTEICFTVHSFNENGVTSTPYPSITIVGGYNLDSVTRKFLKENNIPKTCGVSVEPISQNVVYEMDDKFFFENATIIKEDN